MFFHRRWILPFLLLFVVVINGQFKGFHENLKENCRYCHIGQAKQIQSSDELSVSYASNTLNANISTQLGSSKLCLSCHDGALSVDHFNRTNLYANKSVGIDLSHSHPVSFTYDSYLALNDGALNDPVSTPSGLGGTIASDLLVNGKVECVSCHDVHGFGKGKNMLIMSNYGSKLCLTCHIK